MQKTDNELFNYIIENAPNAKYHPNTQWMDCKCPNCDGASKKNHFNLQLKDGQPMIYRCFRAGCGISGVLNRKMARELGLSNPTFLKVINRLYNDNIVADDRAKMIIKGVKSVDLGDIDIEAADYFKKRTNKELTSQIQQKFRICTSMSRFLDNNRNLVKINYDAIVDLVHRENMYNERYIYFFNERYTMLYGRQINGDRKIKMNISTSRSSLAMHVPYLFRSEGELDYDNIQSDGTLFIGEGIFDIINAYFHLYKNYKGVFMASTSFVATKGCIDFFSKYVYQPNVVILSDSDVDMNFYRFRLLKTINIKRIKNLYVVYNKNGKDLGDYEGRSFNIDTTLLHEGK